MTTPDHNEDIARLFRENDDIGAQSSLWVRPIRQLLDSGKPIGQLTVLAFRGEGTGAYPFGVLTHTDKQRVVFWPVLPRNADMIAANGQNGVETIVVDHAGYAPRALGLNRQVLLDSCRRTQFSLFVNVLEVETYVLFCRLKEVRHGPL